MSYKVFYENGDIFQGGDPNNSKWNEQPDIPIKSIEYSLLGETIVLENYEKYNHVVKRVMFLQGDKQYVSNVILLAKKDSQALRITLNLSKKKIDYDVVRFGKEYNGKPTTGWKQGIEGLKGNSRVK